MKIRRADGAVFVFDIYNYARGEWGYALVKVEGYGPVSHTYSDPDYSTERAARKAARRFAQDAKHTHEYGWHC